MVDIVVEKDIFGIPQSTKQEQLETLRNVTFFGDSLVDLIVSFCEYHKSGTTPPKLEINLGAFVIDKTSEFTQFLWEQSVSSECWTNTLVTRIPMEGKIPKAKWTLKGSCDEVWLPWFVTNVFLVDFDSQVRWCVC